MGAASKLEILWEQSQSFAATSAVSPSRSTSTPGVAGRKGPTYTAKFSKANFFQASLLSVPLPIAMSPGICTLSYPLCSNVFGQRCGGVGDAWRHSETLGDTRFPRVSEHLRVSPSINEWSPSVSECLRRPRTSANMRYCINMQWLWNRLSDIWITSILLEQLMLIIQDINVLWVPIFGWNNSPG